MKKESTVGMLLWLVGVNSFVQPPSSRKYGCFFHDCSTAVMASNPNNGGNRDDDNEGESVNDKIDAFLDKPFFDPNDPKNDDNRFANLVKNDYDFAEALYVGLIGVFGIILAQELLRIVKYGGSSGGGNLF